MSATNTNPTKLNTEQQMELVRQNPNNIKDIFKPTLITQRYVIKKDPSLIKFIQSDLIAYDVAEAVVKHDGMLLQYLMDKKEPPIFENLMLAVQENGFAIQFIPDPCYELQAAATDNYPLSIRYITNPDDRIQIKVVERFPEAIELIANPCTVACEIATEKDPKNIRYIAEPSEECQFRVVKHDPELVVLIKNPTEKVQQYVVSKNSDYIKLIDNPCPEILRIARPNAIHRELTVEEDAKCTISYEPIEQGHRYYKCPRGHLYNEYNFEKWMKTSDNKFCVLCRNVEVNVLDIFINLP